MKHKVTSHMPSSHSAISADTVAAGPSILPIERLKLFSAEQWEEFINEWVNSLDGEYARVERLGGAGDMGRDVVAFTDTDEVWDNYQCKHYDHSLQPSDIWTELGKLVYYTFKGEYSCPRKYYFIAPQGAGTKLSNLFKKPDSLCSGLIDNWDKYCKSKITDKNEVILDEALQLHLKGIDFSIFDHTPPLTIIDQHATTRYYTARFGGGLPPRPQAQTPPEQPESTEATYIRKLLDAYGDHKSCQVNAIEEIRDDGLNEHYKDSRVEFYSAESLRSFSRDSLPRGEYEKLQDEIHDGIRDDLRSDHRDGYQRVVAVVKTARNLQVTSHPLVSCLHVRDRGGICHQLANDKDEVRWVKNEQ